jgi:hypothetical protein
MDGEPYLEAFLSCEGQPISVDSFSRILEIFLQEVVGCRVLITSSGSFLAFKSVSDSLWLISRIQKLPTITNRPGVFRQYQRNSLFPGFVVL